MSNNTQNWRIDIDTDNLAWLHFDKADASTNVLSKDVLAELSEKVTELENSKANCVIIVSDKDNGFIAGADIEGFTVLKNADEGVALIQEAQQLFDRIESLPMPTLCVINGFCLGGGLELALSCRYRLALDDPKTKLGFPEVNLGIFPGFGGSLRSTQLLGAPTAMNMMLTGRNLSARAARKVGLVDAIAPQRLLLQTAKQMALKPPSPHKASFLQRLTNKAIIRNILGNMMRKQVRKKARPEHYPAPFALIDHWVENAGRRGDMLLGEAHKVAELVTGPTAKNLIDVFYMMEAMKSQGSAKDCNAQHVHVIGAGVMGGDIATWCALQGLTVTIQDQKPEFLVNMMTRAHKLFKRKLKQPRLIREALDRIVPDIEGLGVQHADVVIEAIFENVEAKHALYQKLEPVMKPTALLATNTSSIRLEVLSTCLDNPSRLVGLHFFNPVAMMQLVEIVKADNTDDAVVKQACDFARRISRLPLPVKSGPGFLVNRVLMPYLMEAVTLVEEGVPAPLIDKTAKSFGMPMGPIELADTVGLDICLHVAEILTQDMDINVPTRLKDMVEKGLLGAKSGQGFYQYEKGKKVPQASDGNMPKHLQNRLMMRMINEAVSCLDEGVVENQQLLDAGIIFGTGFAPFKGGPMHHIKTEGKETMVSLLDELSTTFGDRFKKDDGWKSLEIG
ncbi:MAG: crotonase [Methylococcales bacterium]|jgi:3-hydroxyacyl-CoA dehydrogenase / enoyl-CoA hydratase / 3-hydroxybutyryl-CoA epimerase|nr:crotonase [Methylococcales bacterium]